MFGKKQSVQISDSVETVIGPSVKVNGDFIGQGDIVVEGSIVGTLQTNSNLRIGTQAVVEAEVSAANAFIAGRVTGNVSIREMLEIAGSAQIEGEITCATISIETGAIINGKLSMHQGAPAKGKKGTEAQLPQLSEV